MGMFRYSPTQGIARGEQKDRAIAVGGWAGCWGLEKGRKDSYNDTLRLTKLTQASIWHIFLAVFNTPHFASETEKFAVSASLRSAPSVAREWRWASPAGKEPKQKPRGDCLEALFWLLHNVLARFWTLNQNDILG